MRTVRYYVINKTTNQAVYAHHSEACCICFKSKLENTEQYAITYKWLSI